jgi:plastocyanin
MLNPSKKTLALLGTGAVAAAAAFAGPAAAQSANTIVVKGGTVMKPGKAIIDNMRFTPLSRQVKSGATVKIDNRTKAPHTLSIVKKSALPKTAAQMEKFFQSPLMGEFMQAHEVDPNNEEAPPGKPLVDVGKEGFDQAGDSIFFMGDESIKVTAAKGANLSYICLLHPWMQGTLRVR